jgi:hypothetical protein
MGAGSGWTAGDRALDLRPAGMDLLASQAAVRACSRAASKEVSTRFCATPQR